MTTIRNKMDGYVRTLKTHPANDAAATELKRHLDDLNAQYWRASYLMEIYISVLQEEARQKEREPDLRQVGEREEGMHKEYEQACLVAQHCLAEHQNMSDIRRGCQLTTPNSLELNRQRTQQQLLMHRVGFTKPMANSSQTP